MRMFDKSETRYKTAWNHSFVLNNQIACRIELTDDLFSMKSLLLVTSDFIDIQTYQSVNASPAHKTVDFQTFSLDFVLEEIVNAGKTMKLTTDK